MKKFLKYKLLFLLLMFTTFLVGQQGQINISRIESMPQQPEPYLMRDWKQVAIKYDSFIYDSNKSGTFLPLVSYTSNGINYPLQKQIKLHTYVGTFSKQNAEGINILPSLVGAALVGQNIRNIYKYRTYIY